MATRCCCPPESWCGNDAVCAARPTRSSSASARAFASPRRQAEHAPRRLGDVVERGEMREEVKALEHHADAPADGPQRRRIAPLAHAGTQPVAGDLDLAGLERRQVVERAEQRRLAAPRRTDDRQHLAALDVEVDAAQDLRAAESRAQPANAEDRLRHAGTGTSRRSRRRASRPSG